MPLCAQCKKPITVGDPFCKNCGRKLSKEPVEPEPKGLWGGLLALIHLNFYLCIFAAFIAFRSSLSVSILLGDASLFYTYTFIVAIISLGLLIAEMILFYKKSKHFPIIYIIASWAGFIMTLFSGDLQDYPGISGLIIGSIILIIVTAYLLKSKRVKHTFVR
jgi:hypothetical protein